jgi:multiple sugar transport system ATP-binding protein
VARIRLEGIEKVYGGGHAAIRGVDLTVGDGEFVVLVGPSGCGKSTTLRVVAGLEAPTAGRVWIGDRDVTELPAQERDLAMVFQSYALYPHMTVAENLGFPLRMRGIGKAVIAERVQRVAETLGLAALLDQKPSQLSGGQRQRVALGRAVIREPQAFLLDEPLSNLDARLRVETRAELARMHRRLGATMLYVTHDQEEAMTLGDRVAVMHEGRLQQVAPPLEIYHRPTNRFVAEFVGSPAMNLLPVTLRRDAGTIRIEGPGITLDQLQSPPAAPESDLWLGVRPSDIRLGAPDQDVPDARGEVEVVEPLGREVLLHLTLAGSSKGELLRVVVPPEDAPALGAAVGIWFRRDRLHLFDRATGERVPT